MAEKELTGDDFAFVYRERARLVAHLAAIYPSLIGVDEAEPDWPVVYVGTVQGQMSWHISRDDLDLFPHVRQVPAGDLWDGHSTHQKYERLAALTELRARGRDWDAAAVKAEWEQLQADIAAAL